MLKTRGREITPVEEEEGDAAVESEPSSRMET
jgi:hypothetical protein